MQKAIHKTRDKNYARRLTAMLMLHRGERVSHVARTLCCTRSSRHCCKVSDEAAFCLIQRPYISKTLLTRRISPRGSP
ncbi:hypothetical protein FMK65_28300 [Klebsiella variicola]|nr:hypothetical protein [Klebsiella variicola]